MTVVYQCKILVEAYFSPYALIDMSVTLKCHVWLDLDHMWIQENYYKLTILIVSAPSEDIMMTWRQNTESYFTIRSCELLTNFDPYTDCLLSIIRWRLEPTAKFPPERNTYELTPDGQTENIGSTDHTRDNLLATVDHNRAVRDRTPLWCLGWWEVKSYPLSDLQQLVLIAHQNKIEIYYQFERTRYHLQSVSFWIKEVTIPEFEPIQEKIQQLRLFQRNSTSHSERCNTNKPFLDHRP